MNEQSGINSWSNHGFMTQTRYAWEKLLVWSLVLTMVILVCIQNETCSVANAKLQEIYSLAQNLQVLCWSVPQCRTLITLSTSDSECGHQLQITALGLLVHSFLSFGPFSHSPISYSANLLFSQSPMWSLTMINLFTELIKSNINLLPVPSVEVLNSGAGEEVMQSHCAIDGGSQGSATIMPSKLHGLDGTPRPGLL